MIIISIKMKNVFKILTCNFILIVVYSFIMYGIALNEKEWSKYVIKQKKENTTKLNYEKQETWTC